jgi:uncharacterized protein (DUF849 family)
MIPEEIAADCDRCMALGASIFHVHARTNTVSRGPIVGD